MKLRILCCCLLLQVLPGIAQLQPGRTPAAAEGGRTSRPEMLQPSSTGVLEHDFFTAIRSGNAKKVLAYVPKEGVNVGANARHLTRAEAEEQLLHQGELYCKLFDSACIKAEVQLDAGNVHACSYRELLTKSQKVRTAATETTRNNVRQAVLVAEVKNPNCAGVGLIDIIFNDDHDSWKLFSIP